MEAAFGSILQAMADVIADIKPTDKTADFDVDFVLQKMDVRLHLLIGNGHARAGELSGQLVGQVLIDVVLHAQPLPGFLLRGAEAPEIEWILP